MRCCYSDYPLVYALLLFRLPSGKSLHSYGQSRCLIGKLTISMEHSYVSQYQRLNPIQLTTIFVVLIPLNHHLSMVKQHESTIPMRAIQVAWTASFERKWGKVKNYNMDNHCAYVYVYIYIDTDRCISSLYTAYTYLNMYKHIYIYIHIYVNMYIYIYICICIYMYTYETECRYYRNYSTTIETPWQYIHYMYIS